LELGRSSNVSIFDHFGFPSTASAGVKKKLMALATEQLKLLLGEYWQSDPKPAEKSRIIPDPSLDHPLINGEILSHLPRALRPNPLPRGRPTLVIWPSQPLNLAYDPPLLALLPKDPSQPGVVRSAPEREIK
jgi:hypothetical protein